MHTDESCPDKKNVPGNCTWSARGLNPQRLEVSLCLLQLRWRVINLAAMCCLGLFSINVVTTEVDFNRGKRIVLERTG